MERKGNSIAVIITIVLVVLKLTDNFEHSWWWVFAPIWVPTIIILAIGLISCIALLFSTRD